MATCLQSLLGEVDARWPERNRMHDGAVGDLSHSKRISDHNPWVRDPEGVGVVRARDFTARGIDADWLVARIVALGVAGDERLRNGGYVIFNGSIWSSQAGWRRRLYRGANKHEAHVHVSVTQDCPQFDSTASWGVQERGPVVKESVMNEADRKYVRSEVRAAVNEAVASIQRHIVTVLRATDQPSIKGLDGRLARIEKKLGIEEI